LSSHERLVLEESVEVAGEVALEEAGGVASGFALGDLSPPGFRGDCFD
jgi:hypothetical protein